MDPSKAPPDHQVTLEHAEKEGPMTIERRLKELGLELPPVVVPYANYVPYVREGSLLFIAGQAPTKQGALRYVGRVGA